MFLVASSRNNISDSTTLVSQKHPLASQDQAIETKSRELEVSQFIGSRQERTFVYFIKPLVYLTKAFINALSKFRLWLSTSLGPWLIHLSAVLFSGNRSSLLQLTLPSSRISPITSTRSTKLLVWSFDNNCNIDSFNEDNFDDAMDLSRGRAFAQRANSYSTSNSTSTSTSTNNFSSNNNNNNNNNHYAPGTNVPYLWEYATISPINTRSRLDARKLHQSNLNEIYSDYRQLKADNIHQHKQQTSMDIPVGSSGHSCCFMAEDSNVPLSLSRYPDLHSQYSQEQQQQQQQKEYNQQPMKSRHASTSARALEYSATTCAAAQSFPSGISNGQSQEEKQTKPGVQPAAMLSNPRNHNGCSRTGAEGGDSSGPGYKIMESDSSLVLVSKTALSDLTEQIAFSMSKMRDIEERVKVIPDLQRRLEHVISDSGNFRETSNILGTTSAIQSKSTMPAARAPLDCGCQSFRDHLRYNNSINREKRQLNHHIKSYSHSSAANSAISSHSNTRHHRNLTKDASTNTELSMGDVLTRAEMDILISSMQQTCSLLSPSESHNEDAHVSPSSRTNSKSSSVTSTSGSISGPNSSATPDNRTDSCGSADLQDEAVSDTKTDPSSSTKDTQHYENDNDDDSGSSRNSASNNEDDEEEDADTGSLNLDEPYSLGSSYQDPSDFEEYCAYGESLDRRTKDFMSNSTKITNDLRFALIRLNDYIKQKRPINHVDSSSGCIEVIRKAWFDVAARKDSQAKNAKFYVDYLESFTKQLLNTVVNLTDSAGNTAMHYAASHYKLDIIQILLDTKVCDVNSRNKAGYTPIMLLALTEMESAEDQEVARNLFSMGDVNVKARTNGQTALMLASSHGRIATCRLLLECGADPSLQDFDGSTALMCGSEQGHESIVRCLLAHRLTDPNAVDNDGLDALRIAMNNGHKSIGLILYRAKNVPKMVRSSIGFNGNHNNNSMGIDSLGASMRRSRTKPAVNYVRRADSLLGSRSGQLPRVTDKNL